MESRAQWQLCGHEDYGKKRLKKEAQFTENMLPVLQLLRGTTVALQRPDIPVFRLVFFFLLHKRIVLIFMNWGHPTLFFKEQDIRKIPSNKITIAWKESFMRNVLLLLLLRNMYAGAWSCQGSSSPPVSLAVVPSSGQPCFG